MGGPQKLSAAGGKKELFVQFLKRVFSRFLFKRFLPRQFLIRSLSFKLTLAFLLVSLTGVALVAVLIWGINSIEFNRFLQDRGMTDFTSAAAAYYQENGSWAGVAEAMREENLTLSPGQSEGGRSFSAAIRAGGPE
jgi:hypothetical protein